MPDDGWTGDADDETVARTEQGTDAAVTVAIATVIMVMMVTLLLVHALA
jgi:cell division protein FtsX